MHPVFNFHLSPIKICGKIHKFQQRELLPHQRKNVSRKVGADQPWDPEQEEEEAVQGKVSQGEGLPPLLLAHLR